MSYLPIYVYGHHREVISLMLHSISSPLSFQRPTGCQLVCPHVNLYICTIFLQQQNELCYKTRKEKCFTTTAAGKNLKDLKRDLGSTVDKSKCFTFQCQLEHKRTSVLNFSPLCTNLPQFLRINLESFLKVPIISS